MVPVSDFLRNQAHLTALGASRPLPADRPSERGKSSGSAGKIRTRRILVVDDELLIRWSLSEGLVKAGFEVVEAGDARSAMLRLADGAPAVDAILLDLRLPDSADLRLLTWIRQMQPTVPVIMMTAYGSPDTTDEALRLGAREVVSKPFDLNRMVRLVHDALA
jgi:two-component system NtrC family response regulator